MRVSIVNDNHQQSKTITNRQLVAATATEMGEYNWQPKNSYNRLELWRLCKHLNGITTTTAKCNNKLSSKSRDSSPMQLAVIYGVWFVIASFALCVSDKHLSFTKATTMPQKR